MLSPLLPQLLNDIYKVKHGGKEVDSHDDQTKGVSSFEPCPASIRHVCDRDWRGRLTIDSSSLISVLCESVNAWIHGRESKRDKRILD